MSWLKVAQDPKTWIVGIAIALIALHLILVERANNPDLVGMSLVFWVAVSTLIWERRNTFKLESGIFSSFLGASLLACVLLKSSSIAGYDFFLRILPFISAFSIALLASGVKGLKQYWQELFILAFIIIPPGLILRFFDIGTVTAKLTGFILWYAGFSVTRQDLLLILPTGSVEVGYGCTGVSAMLQLVGISILFLFMFPDHKRLHRILLPLVAIVIAFIVNTVRVALLALIVSNTTAFDYWHQGTGSLIFSMIAVGIFGLFCWFTVLRKKPILQNGGE